MAVTVIDWRMGDPDFWWHIADGHYILQHLTLPQFSPWVFGAVATHHWTMAEWLSEVWMSAVGLYGVIFICAALFAAVCVVGVWRARTLGGKMAPMAMMIPFVTALLGWAELAPRDQMATTLGVALMAMVCERQIVGKKVWWWLLPPAYALWANLHPGFVVGLGIWFVAILVWWWEGRRGKSTPALRVNLIWWAASCAATLLTPYGFKLWIYIASTLHGGAAAYIQEWQSPNFHWVTFAPILLLVIVGLPLAWSRLSLLAKIWIVVSLGASLYSGRNVELLGVIAAPLLVLAWMAAWQDKAWRPNLREPTWLFGVLAIALTGLAVYNVTTEAVAPFTNSIDPVSAVQVLNTQYPPGLRIFPTYNNAGYILEHLPQDKVWLYGDNALTGGKVLGEYVNINNLGRGWEKQLRAIGADIVITQPGSPLASALQLIPGCRLIYNKYQWMVFTGAGPSCPVQPIAQFLDHKVS